MFLFILNVLDLPNFKDFDYSILLNIRNGYFKLLIKSKTLIHTLLSKKCNALKFVKTYLHYIISVI